MSSLEIMLGKKAYQPGEKVDGQVILKLDKSTKARDVVVEIYGNEHTHITITRYSPSTKTNTSTTYTEDVPLISKETSLLNKVSGRPPKKDEQVVLTPNVHTIPFSFNLPKDATPTYNGEHAEVNYQVSAKVDIPWGFDVNNEKSFFVIPKEGIKGEGDPVTLEKQKGKINMSVELNRGNFKRGEYIKGRVKVKNDAGKEIRKILVDLYANEHAEASSYTEDSRVMHSSLEIPVDQPETNYFEQNFKIQVPYDVVPTLEKDFFNIDWYFEVGLDVAMARDVTRKTPIIIK